MNETTKATIADILTLVATGALSTEFALARIDKIVMAERIAACAEGHQLTRKIYRFPAGA